MTFLDFFRHSQKSQSKLKKTQWRTNRRKNKRQNRRFAMQTALAMLRNIRIRKIEEKKLNSNGIQIESVE